MVQKKNTSIETKILKIYYFGVQNDGIWQINDDSMKYVDLFQLKSWTNLSESEFWSQKTKEHRHESLKKKYHFGAKTMEFGRKTMILWRSPSRWHISNRKVALICLKLNYGEKKTTTEMKIFKKMPFWRPKQWNLAEKRWTSYRVQSVDPFPIEKLHQFVRIWILAQKNNEHRNKNF